MKAKTFTCEEMAQQRLLANASALCGHSERHRVRYRPNPDAFYVCPYCNSVAQLRAADVVVDSYLNVCHYDCLPSREVD